MPLPTNHPQGPTRSPPNTLKATVNSPMFSEPRQVRTGGGVQSKSEQTRSSAKRPCSPPSTRIQYEHIGQNPSNMLVDVGDTVLSTEMESFSAYIEVAEIILHPNFNKSFSNNIDNFYRRLPFPSYLRLTNVYI